MPTDTRDINLSVWVPWYPVRSVCIPCEKTTGASTCFLLYIHCCDCVSNKVQLSCTVVMSDFPFWWQRSTWLTWFKLTDGEDNLFCTEFFFNFKISFSWLNSKYEYKTTWHYRDAKIMPKFYLHRKCVYILYVWNAVIIYMFPVYVQTSLKFVLLRVLEFVQSPEAAQVSWRWADRRPSVLLYGVFLKSEASQKCVNFSSRTNRRHV